MRKPRRVVSKIIVLLGPSRRWRWIVVVALAVCVALLEAAGAVLIFGLIGQLATPSEGTPDGVLAPLSSLLPTASVQELQLAAAGLVGLFLIVRGLAMVGQTYVQHRIVHNAGAHLADRLLRGYLAMPYLEHTRSNSATLVRNSYDAVQMFVAQVLMPLVRVLAELFIIVALTVVLVALSPLATVLAVLVLAPTLFVVLRVVQPRLKRQGSRAQEARRRALQAVQESLGGVRDIKLLGRERHFAARHLQERLRLARAQYLRYTLTEAPRALMETTLLLVVVAVFMVATVGGQTFEGVLSTLGLFAYAGLRLQPSLRTVVSGVNDLRFAGALIDDLTADHRRASAALAPSKRVGGPSAPPLETVIEFDAVDFAYNAQGPPTLTRVDLTIRKGEFIGVCGPTGGGKSTLVDLLVGLLEPTKGRILADGRDIRENLAWWQEQLGVVSQHVFLVDDTLRRNIAFGQEDDQIDEARLQGVMGRAQLHDVLAGLPDGLDTYVGERGIRLSGGQRQRVAIARALYRDPQILVLDEGTSALDSLTESALVAAIEEEAAERTVVAVAHRLSTVRHASRIVVVANGRVVEEGSYDELLEESELFRSLAT